MNTINKVISTASHRALGIFLGCVLFSAGAVLPAYGQGVDCEATTDGSVSPTVACSDSNNFADGDGAKVDAYNIPGTTSTTRTDRVYVQGATGDLGTIVTLDGNGAATGGGREYFVEINGVNEIYYLSEANRMAGAGGMTLAEIRATATPIAGAASIAATVAGTTTTTATPAGVEGTAVGDNAYVNGDKSTAIGAGAKVGTEVTTDPALIAPNSVAVGAGATVIGAADPADAGEATAIGVDSRVVGKGGIAVGYNSVADANEVVIGAVDDAGTPDDASDDTPATNAAGQNLYTKVWVGGVDLLDTRADVTQNEDDILANRQAIDANTALINTFEDDIETNRSGIAMAVALAHLPLIEGPRGGWAIAGGSFDGESAVAIGANWNVGTNKFIKLGVANSNGESSFGAGFGMGF